MKAYAVRNLRLCTKDCLCLYVCPTGATDTENSIIDRDKCIGCGVCAKACPSQAISMMPLELPLQQKHDEKVVHLTRQAMLSKAHQEQVSATWAGVAKTDESYRLATALKKSARLMAEDLNRESGYMLPQSANSFRYLQKLEAQFADQPEIKEHISALLHLLKCNETKES